MKPYADTNFFTRLYLPFQESEQAERLVTVAKSAGALRLPITWLHRMEITNAMEFSVWFSKQGGEPRVSPQIAAVALDGFKTDMVTETFLRREALDASALPPLFEEMAARHTAKHGFRTYDILHVISAQLLGCDRFFSYDQKAIKLAKLEGLEVGPLT